MQTLLLSEEKQTLTIIINRPDKLNALNKQVIEELSQTLQNAGSNEKVKCVIITGQGAKAFVAGADIAELEKLKAEGGRLLAKKGNEQVFTQLENFNKPVIAAINGFALGGGLELAIACHIRIASDNAKFGLPEVNLGLIPGYGGTQRLPLLVGKGKALEMILTGGMIDAPEALQLGLVNYVVSPSELLTKATTLAAQLATKAPLAVAGAIAAVNAAYTGNGQAKETDIFAGLFDTNDAIEGRAAFMQKRAPVFKGN